MTEISEAYLALPKRPNILVLPNEVIQAANVPESEKTQDLIDTLTSAIERQTLLAFGENWEDKILPEKVEYARIEVLYRTLLEQFPMPENRSKCIIKMIREAEVRARTTYQIVRHYLRQNMYTFVTVSGIVAGLEVGRQVYEFLKGEFRHYEEIEPYIKKAKSAGATVRVLKGDDEQGAAVVKDLNAASIPAKLWKYQTNYPKVRLYHLNKSYLLLLSLGDQEFAAFKGTSDEGVKAAESYYNACWKEAQELQ